MKICITCKVEKELTEFSNKRNQCKCCKNEQRKCKHGKFKCKKCIKEKENEKNEIKKMEKEDNIIKNVKLCTNCNIEKTINDFYKKHGRCKDCYNNSRKCIHDIYIERCEECIKEKKENIDKKIKICTKCNIEQGISEFRKDRNICKTCNNKSKECEHNIRKEYCINCPGGGSALCIHKIRKSRCKECNPKEIKIKKIIKKDNDINKLKTCLNCNIEKELIYFHKNHEMCIKCFNNLKKCKHNLCIKDCKECIKLKNKMCISENCNKLSSFNYKEEKKALYCSLHKLKNMINIYSKNCIFENCNIKPSFNYENEKQLLYCSTHKLENMVDIKNKKCEFENCKIIPIFNYENKKNAKYCNEHKKENMVDIKNKKCIFENCNKHALYNFENQIIALYCNDHKENNMIDIKSKRCKFENCKKFPNFNYLGEKNKLYCNEHKLENMVNIHSKICIFENCNIQSTFNYKEEKKALYCSLHKSKDMINVVNKLCKGQNGLCDLRVSNKKLRGYCSYCFFHTFPDEPITRNYKTKENSVVNFIKEEFKQYDITCNKLIQDGCTKRRPDILFDFGEKVIIIEIDENQYRDYDTTCEQERLNNLIEDINYRNLILIKFNPDYYKLGVKHINSPWKLNKNNGLLEIINKKEWNKRLNTLKEVLENIIKEDIIELFKIIPLFYDEIISL